MNFENMSIPSIRGFEDSAASEVADASARFDPARRFVRVRGRKRGLVEFDFAIGDPEVAVEMLMQPEDFHAFCREQKVEFIDADSPDPSHLPPPITS